MLEVLIRLTARLSDRRTIGNGVRREREFVASLTRARSSRFAWGQSFSAFNYPAVPYTGNDFHSACNIDWK